MSASTVSRAYSNPELLAPATLERILLAAEHLSYRPEPDRGLPMLATVVPDITNPVFSAVIRGAEHEAARAGHVMILMDSEESHFTESADLGAIKNSVSGLVLVSSRMPDTWITELAAEVPVVLVNRRLADVPSVTVDTRAAVDDAVSHLVSLGHDRLTYISGPESSWSNRQRRSSLSDICRERGLALNVLGPFPASYEGGRAAAERVIIERPTALVVFGSIGAAGVISRLRERAVSVPEDVSVLSCDDSFPFNVIEPRLTSLTADLELMGRLAAHRLLAVAEGSPVDQSVSAHLSIRQSTGPRAGHVDTVADQRRQAVLDSAIGPQRSSADTR